MVSERKLRNRLLHHALILYTLRNELRTIVGSLCHHKLTQKRKTAYRHVLEILVQLRDGYQNVQNLLRSATRRGSNVIYAKAVVQKICRGYQYGNESHRCVTERNSTNNEVL